MPARLGMATPITGVRRNRAAASSTPAGPGAPDIGPEYNAAVTTKTLLVTAVLLSAAIAVAGRAQTRPAPDVIFYNGKVITVDAAFSLAEAVAITGDRIT